MFDVLIKSYEKIKANSELDLLTVNTEPDLTFLVCAVDLP